MLITHDLGRAIARVDAAPWPKCGGAKWDEQGGFLQFAGWSGWPNTGGK
jgi:hypothetical protein